MVDKIDPITLREYAGILGISAKTALRKGKLALKQMIIDKVKEGTLSEDFIVLSDPPTNLLDVHLKQNDIDTPTIVGSEKIELLETINHIKDLDNNTKFHAHIVQNNAMKILKHYTESLVMKIENNPTQDISVFVAKNVMDIVKTLAGKDRRKSV